MTALSRVPACLFLFLACAVAAPLVVRTVRILPLYTDASVRDRAEVTLRQLASREGWLLSDIEVREVTRDGLVLLYREHRRNPASPQCFALSFSTSESHPCAE